MPRSDTAIEQEYLTWIRRRHAEFIDAEVIMFNEEYMSRPLDVQDLSALVLEVNKLSRENRVLRNSEDVRIFYAEQKIQKVREWCQYESTKPELDLAARAAYELVLLQIGKEGT